MPFDFGKEEEEEVVPHSSGAAPTSGLAGRASVDGEGVNALRKQRTEAIIYEAMSGDARQPSKPLADQAHVKVASFASSSVAGVQVAVVADLDLGGLQCSMQSRFKAGRGEECRRGVHGERFGACASGACGATCQLM